MSRRPYEFSADVSSFQKEDPQEAITRELQRRDPELSVIIDFLENDVLPLNEKSARKLLLTSETFYIGKDGLLRHLDQNRKRNSHDAFINLLFPRLLNLRSYLTFMLGFLTEKLSDNPERQELFEMLPNHTVRSAFHILPS